MTRAFTRLAYTASVRAAQQRNGAREHSERMAERPPERDALPDEMQARIANANSVIIGTASLEGWPHLQHRGGPRGFIKVLGPRSLVFADYAGNRQYITIGNLAENGRNLPAVDRLHRAHAAENLGPRPSRRGRSRLAGKCA